MTFSVLEQTKATMKKAMPHFLPKSPRGENYNNNNSRLPCLIRIII